MENSRCGKGELEHWFKAKEKCTDYFDYDPVECRKSGGKRRKKQKPKEKESEEVILRPTLSKRVEIMKANIFDPTLYPCGGADIPRPMFVCPTTKKFGEVQKYVAPTTKKFREEQKERRRQYREMLNFHEYKTVEMHGCDAMQPKTIKLEVGSAEIKEAKLMPRKPSATPSDLYPDPPSAKDLKKKQPKSGTVINVKKKKRKPLPKVMAVIEHDDPTIEAIMAQELATILEVGEGGEDGTPPDNYLTKQFRRRVEQMSRSTSVQSRDYKQKEPAEDDEEVGLGTTEPEDRFISTLVQKFRRESEIHRHETPKRRTKHGTLENFSFTRLKQTTLKTFYYGVKLGTISQDDRNFSQASRNKQGICMPIAAYCYSIVRHPDRWTQADIDNVLEAGDNLFVESAGTQHLHGDSVELHVSNLRKYCIVGKMKVRFAVSEPEISGMVRSDDKKIYNLTQGLNIFFTRFKAGILETEALSVAIWKDKHFYFFDAGHRTIDLYTHGNGVALMANFYDTCSVLSVLLDRSNLENLPFIIYSIQAYKVLTKDAEEVDSTGVIPEIDNFQVLDEEKAVALGGFDLADKCFGFSRNKQGLTIAVVALVYSKITPPSSWHKGTIDKIVIIGNQLFLECIENDTIEAVKVDDLPAFFTIGPYIIEIHIIANCMVDFMTKKSKNMLQERLEKFFETNSNAIVQIESYTIAVWKQRNIYHCFDPYSRNREGLKCRDGTACASMHTNLESMIQMISTNFEDKDMIFHVHAMKVCKIHRDPNTTDMFPKCMTMNEYPAENFKKMKMRRGKKKAVTKTVTVDRDMRATLIETLADSSLMEVGSTVRSIGMEDLPPMCHRANSRSMILASITPLDADFVADLDSPSLSDTQIEPAHLQETDEETGISFQDVDSFDLTQEEKEMVGRGEGGEGKQGEGEDGASKTSPEDGGEGEDGVWNQWYMAAADFTQVGSQSLLSRMSDAVNTEAITVVIPDEEVPAACRDISTLEKWSRKNRFEQDTTVLGSEPDVTLSEELQKETNFVEMPDASQIISGTINMVGDGAAGDDAEVMSPFVCIMATVVAKKYSIETWTREVIDYVIECGEKLYSSSNTRYDQNYKLEIPRISLGKTDFTVKVDYLFDTFIKPRILTLALHNLLFCHHPAGILVTPAYSCALFLKNHLYYLYDGFAHNEVGLGKTSNEGTACLCRFQDIYGLVVRILHNKARREQEENVEYNRFVLSSCHVKQIPKLEEEEKKSEQEVTDGTEGEEEGGGGEDEDLVIVPPESYKKKKQPPPKKPCKYGYQLVGKLWKIEGTVWAGGEKNEVSEKLLTMDYFMSLCACLMSLNLPFKRWYDKKVDEVCDTGASLFVKYRDADELLFCLKKYVTGILIGDYCFDVVVHMIDFTTYTAKTNLKKGFEAMLAKKHQLFMIQTSNMTYAIKVEDSIYHFFHPMEPSWTRYTSLNKLLRRIKSGLVKGHTSFHFHVFEVMSISKAPKDVIVSNRTKKFKCKKSKKDESMGKVFYEEFSWLAVDPIPWSWKVNKSHLCLWNDWYVEFPEDLFSLFGSLSPLDERFPKETRRKQTLGNLVVVIGMMQIYELAEWTVNVMDSVLLHGDEFFRKCIKDISDENYEVAFEDIKKECEIFPYKFRVQFTPVVEGTIFLVRLKQFNLYKSLRLFFDDYVKRFGVICVTKGEKDRRLFAFGKIQEKEYFLYDCITLGPPMYDEKDAGVPYILRTTSLNRLLHVMTLTLRGGDFYIFEVGLSELQALKT